MVKGGSTQTTWDPIRTRQQSNSQGRRNSVSDVKEFFQAKVDDSPKAMSTRKPSGKKEKERERAREIKATRENIKDMINNLNKDAKSKQITNGDNDNEISETSQAQLDYAGVNHVEQTHAEQSGEISLSSTATQTSEDEILIAIKELVQKYKSLEDAVEDPRNGLTMQLAKTQATVGELYSDINGAVSGLKVQMEKITKVAEDHTKAIQSIQNGQKKMASLLDENKRLVQELKVMQGLVQKLSQQSLTNANQIMDLTKRGMEQNLLLHGVDDSIETDDPQQETPMYTYKERPKFSAIKFFTEIMNIQIEPADIWKAHRMGPRKPDKVRPLILKVSYPAKELIMENLHALKDQSNSITKQKYFISEQIPEGITERKKQVSNRVKFLKDQNDSKPKAEKSSISVVNNTILVDNKVDIPEITTPQPSELFLDEATQQQIDTLQAELVETEKETHRNSDFIGLAAHADNLQKVQQLYVAVMQRYPAVDHAMMAYAMKQDDTLKTGCCDDKEYGAGIRLRKLIFDTKLRNTVVFVLQKYGGVHLGFNRFSIIESVARQAIQLLQG